MKIHSLHVVATVTRDDGSSDMVGCAVRERDLDADVIVYLREQACGMHGTPSPDPAAAEFEHDSLGG